MEEGFGEDDEEEYALKPYKRKSETKGKKVKKKEESEEEYCPESSEEEEGERGKHKKCKDDGNVEYYRQRIRYDDHVLAAKNLYKLLVILSSSFFFLWLWLDAKVQKKFSSASLYIHASK